MGTRSSSSWASVRELIGALVQEINSLLPFTLEVENVVKSMYSLHTTTFMALIHLTVKGEAPWVLRVEEVKSTAAVNLDAERKVVKLHEEMQDLVRSVKTRVRITRWDPPCPSFDLQMHR
jgi:dynactin 1